jgi:hypothetical protein
MEFRLITQPHPLSRTVCVLCLVTHLYNLTEAQQAFLNRYKYTQFTQRDKSQRHVFYSHSVVHTDILLESEEVKENKSLVQCLGLYIVLNM